MITATEKAIKKIKSNLDRRGHGIGIRIGVRTTGCAGFAYVLEYVDQINPDDTEYKTDGISIIVDHKSLLLVDGTEIDYVRQGLNEGFEFKNPNEKDRCGCNESFRI